MNKNKILIIANTYFQLITAINLKLTKFKSEYVDIIITDMSVNHKKIAKNLKECNIFSDIKIVNCHRICYEVNKLIRLYYLLNWKKALKNFVEEYSYEEYTTLLFFNFDVFTYSIYNKLYLLNNNIKVCRYEEGFISYIENYSDFYINRISRFLSKIKGTKSLEKNISKFYFYHPRLVLFNDNYEYETIENLNRNNKELLYILNKTFDYKHIINEYNKKYIFFEESFYEDGRDIDDLELILKIADIVGKENILIKLHPRTKINRFDKFGILTNKTVGIPWEVIQMNNNFSDKVFLTISSGSVLASRLYFNDNIKTYLLFNCTERKSDMATDDFFEYLEKVKEEFGMKDFIIPKDKSEFFKMLRKNNK